MVAFVVIAGLAIDHPSPLLSLSFALQEVALADLMRSPVTVMGAGRTDAGVHALGQVFHADLRRIPRGAAPPADDHCPPQASAGGGSTAAAASLQPYTPGEIVRAVNQRLPPNIAVTSAAVAPAGFHARYQANSRTYVYRIVEMGHR